MFGLSSKKERLNFGWMTETDNKSADFVAWHQIIYNKEWTEIERQFSSVSHTSFALCLSFHSLWDLVEITTWNECKRDWKSESQMKVCEHWELRVSKIHIWTFFFGRQECTREARNERIPKPLPPHTAPTVTTNQKEATHKTHDQQEITIYIRWCGMRIKPINLHIQSNQKPRSTIHCIFMVEIVIRKLKGKSFHSGW